MGVSNYDRYKLFACVISLSQFVKCKCIYLENPFVGKKILTTTFWQESISRYSIFLVFTSEGNTFVLVAQNKLHEIYKGILGKLIF